MPAPNEISPKQLARLIGTPNAPIVLDLRIDEDFNENPVTIPAALRHPFQTVGDLAPQLQGQKVVVVCHKGRKISQGAAAVLRSHGVAAEVLEGGQVAWLDAGMITTKDAPQNSLWVTRHRPKIDRIACPWLIRRFVDPKAQFLYVPPQDVLLVAEKFNATPFDVDGADIGHGDGTCSFDALLQRYDIKDSALDTLAQVVRAADLNDHAGSPQAAGLLAMSVGLSRMFADDLAQLDAAMPLYDALYRWARDGQNETHSHDGAC